MADKKNEWARLKMAEIRRVRGGACEHCGSTAQLEFAHVAPTGLEGRSRGRKERLRDIRRNPLRYLLLCRPCHLYLDSRGTLPEAIHAR